MADLNFLNITNCDLVTFNTSTVDLQFIEYVTGSIVKDFTDVERYSITYSNNCCSPGITTYIRPLYQFEASITACVSGPVFGVPSGTYTIQLDGINASFVDTFTVNNGGGSIAWPFVNTGGVLTFDLPQGDVVPTVDWAITITTNAGFVYIIEFTITQSGAVSCDGVIGALTITYPDLPANIVEVPTINPEEELSLNELIGETTISSGIYEVIFCEELIDGSVCIQNHVFIDCGDLKCQVVNKLVDCIDSNIMDYYNALTWGNDCTESVTYAEFCALYEIITIIIQSDGCYGKLDDCNCTDATTISNKLYPVVYPTTTNNNGCHSC